MKNQKNVVVTEPRKFLGKTENFENKEERHFFQRMLRAYLKGHKEFAFGFRPNGMPKKHTVLTNQ